MQRRRFVQLSGSAVATALAGCTGGGDGGDGEDDPATPDKAFRVGESAQYEGLEATVYGYDLVDAYELYNDRSEQYPSDEGHENYEEPPTAGGIFLFLDLGVKNVGEERIPVPGVGEEYGIYGTYGGSSIEFFNESAKVRSRAGHEYEDIFSQIVAEKNATENGIFPGYELRAWVICEVSRQLERELLTIKVDLGMNRQDGESHVIEFKVDNSKPNRTPEGYDHEFDDSEDSSESDSESGDGDSSDGSDGSDDSGDGSTEDSSSDDGSDDSGSDSTETETAESG